jgi:opacity protein-like surface antigen
MRKLLFVASLLLLLPLATQAQDKPKVEVFGGYSYLRTDDRIDLDLHGWNASVTGNLNEWFGVKADFSGHYTDHEISPGIKADINTHLFLVGGQFAYRKNDTWQPFGHVMAGAARTTFSPPRIIGPSSSDSNFAFVVGGGLDAHIAKNLAIRIFQADYVLIHDGDIDENFHNFRFSTGVVLRLGDH